jgi:nitroimidazol reductase NimA-like FMN-containing flavoprotein (pyridoxamine 5'-phosphate oxidase superfamily)
MIGGFRKPLNEKGERMDVNQVKRLLKNLFETQRLAVLATQGRDGPYTSLMTFAATDDLKHLLFATDRVTRKYANISKNPRVSLLIDNRSPNKSRTNFAVTAMGKTKAPAEHEGESLRKIFLMKHPDLREFVNGPGCVLLSCSVEEYVIVKNFQDVVVYRPE